MTREQATTYIKEWLKDEYLNSKDRAALTALIKDSEKWKKIIIDKADRYYEGCSKCVYGKDTTETCRARSCIHAIYHIRECYKPIMNPVDGEYVDKQEVIRILNYMLETYDGHEFDMDDVYDIGLCELSKLQTVNIKTEREQEEAEDKEWGTMEERLATINKEGKITMSKSNKINNLINELHKDQMELMKLLKIYIGMETLGLCISSLDPEDKNYKIIHDYLLARVDELYELSDEAHLTVL